MMMTIKIPFPDVDLISHSPPIMRFWDKSYLEGQAPYVEPEAVFQPTRRCSITHCSLVIEGGEYDLPRFKPGPIQLRAGDTLEVTVRVKRV